MQKDAGQRDAILLHDGVVGATRKKLLLERSWAEFSEAEEPVESCGDGRERGTVDALGLIKARVDFFEDTDCEREARARGAMVQSLEPARTWLESRPGMDVGMMPDSSTTDLMAEAYVRIVAAE